MNKIVVIEAGEHMLSSQTWKRVPFPDLPRVLELDHEYYLPMPNVRFSTIVKVNTARMQGSITIQWKVRSWTPEDLFNYAAKIESSMKISAIARIWVDDVINNMHDADVDKALMSRAQALNRFVYGLFIVVERFDYEIMMKMTAQGTTDDLC